MNDIYVSTGAFRSRDLTEILRTAEQADLRAIELAPGLNYDGEMPALLRKHRDSFSFMIHNYFPTPRESFALNLASDDPDTIWKSMAMCRNNVDTCAALGIPYYSLHCGFCFHTDGRHLGNASQGTLPVIPYEKARAGFVENVKNLCDYAAGQGVSIAIENNVQAAYTADREDLLLGVTGKELLELLSLCERNNLYILLDLAHAKVSGNVRGFDVDGMIRELADTVIEVHISDNDGCTDQNLPVGRDSADMIRWLEMLREKIWTIEAYQLETGEIHDQITFLKELKKA